MLLKPAMAAPIVPNPANIESGPVCPKRLLLSMMVSGLMARSES